MNKAKKYDQLVYHLLSMLLENSRTQRAKENLARLLYWEFLEISPAVIAKEILNISQNALLRIINPLPSDIKCGDCRKRLMYKNRSQMKVCAYYEGSLCEDCSWRRAKNAGNKQYRKRLRQLKTMPYAEYLQSPEWQIKRLAKLEEAGFKCQTCGASRDEKILDIHHLTYVRRGEEKLSDLSVLCRDCHNEVYQT